MADKKQTKSTGTTKSSRPSLYDTTKAKKQRTTREMAASSTRRVQRIAK